MSGSLTRRMVQNVRLGKLLIQLEMPAPGLPSAMVGEMPQDLNSDPHRPTRCQQKAHGNMTSILLRRACGRYQGRTKRPQVCWLPWPDYLPRPSAMAIAPGGAIIDVLDPRCAKSLLLLAPETCGPVVDGKLCCKTMACPEELCLVEVTKMLSVQVWAIDALNHPNHRNI